MWHIGAVHPDNAFNNLVSEFTNENVLAKAIAYSKQFPEACVTVEAFARIRNVVKNGVVTVSRPDIAEFYTVNDFDDCVMAIVWHGHLPVPEGLDREDGELGLPWENLTTREVKAMYAKVASFEHAAGELQWQR